MLSQSAQRPVLFVLTGDGEDRLDGLHVDADVVRLEAAALDEAEDAVAGGRALRDNDLRLRVDAAVLRVLVAVRVANFVDDNKVVCSGRDAGDGAVELRVGAVDDGPPGHLAQSLGGDDQLVGGRVGGADDDGDEARGAM